MGDSVSLDALYNHGTKREFGWPAFTPSVIWGNMRNRLSFYGRLGVPFWGGIKYFAAFRNLTHVRHVQ